jgi:hypothetical protein
MLKGDDIILMPAVWDGFSAKVVEAMLLISPEKQILSAGLMPMMASLFPAEVGDEPPLADFPPNLVGKPFLERPGRQYYYLLFRATREGGVVVDPTCFT